MTLIEKSVDPRVKRTDQVLQQAFMELFLVSQAGLLSIVQIEGSAREPIYQRCNFLDAACRPGQGIEGLKAN